MIPMTADVTFWLALLVDAPVGEQNDIEALSREVRLTCRAISPQLRGRDIVLGPYRPP
jgi:hypothetical protein